MPVPSWSSSRKRSPLCTLTSPRIPPASLTSAAQIVRAVYELGRVVERHTGLTGYDPQAGVSLAEAATRPEDAVKAFDQVAGLGL